jgi:mycothiol synthase
MNTQIRKINKNYRIRPANLNDSESISNLLNACWGPLTGNYSENTKTDIHREHTVPGFDINNSTRLVESEKGEIIAYVKVSDMENPPVHPFINGGIHPHHQNQGIASLLMQWSEERAKQALTRVPEDTRISIHYRCMKDCRPAEVLFDKHGVNPIRYFFEMKLELNEEPAKPIFPNNISLCTFKENSDLEAILHAILEIFKDHWGFHDINKKEELARWKHFLETDKDFDPNLWYIAMYEEEIAGVCLCDPKFMNNYSHGYVDCLGIKRKWRKQGLAKALLLHSFNKLFELKKEKVYLHVDASSLTGATKLYEGVGMHVSKTFTNYEKEIRPGKELATVTL